MIRVLDFRGRGRVEHLMPFDQALALAHPDAPVWWDRDVGGVLAEDVAEVIVTSGGTHGLCEVTFTDNRDDVWHRGFYRLCEPEFAWFKVREIGGSTSPEWAARKAAQRAVREPLRRHTPSSGSYMFSGLGRPRGSR